MMSDFEEDKNPLLLHEDDDFSFLENPYSQLYEIDEEICLSPQNLRRSNLVPPKKRHYFVTSDTCRSFERLNEHACIVCDVVDDYIVPCSGNECPLLVHRNCVELDSEDLATSYCPYCWFKDQATGSFASRTMVVAMAKALVQYAKLKSGGRIIGEGDTSSENSLSIHLHENLNQLREVVQRLKVHNLLLEESDDHQLVEMEKTCGETSVVVPKSARTPTSVVVPKSARTATSIDVPKSATSVVVPKRVLWTIEEENMLKMGVKNFSTKINKNMPWMKILKMGKGIFHENRTSSDLKDKWRKISHL